jgi:hypothetical protein
MRPGKLGELAALGQGEAAFHRVECFPCGLELAAGLLGDVAGHFCAHARGIGAAAGDGQCCLVLGFVSLHVNGRFAGGGAILACRLGVGHLIGSALQCDASAAEIGEAVDGAFAVVTADKVLRSALEEGDHVNGFGAFLGDPEPGEACLVAVGLKGRNDRVEGDRGGLDGYAH